MSRIPSDTGNLELCEIRWASSQGAAHQAGPICGKFAHQFVFLRSYRIFLKQKSSINYFCCETKRMFTWEPVALLDKGKGTQML